jgi:hypothetical protein
VLKVATAKDDDGKVNSAHGSIVKLNKGTAATAVSNSHVADETAEPGVMPPDAYKAEGGVGPSQS